MDPLAKDSMGMSAVNCIKKIRDIAVLKMKVNESLNIFPKEYQSVGVIKLDPPSPQRKTKNDKSVKFDSEMGEVSINDSTSINFGDNYIKKEKKNIKRSRKDLEGIKELLGDTSSNKKASFKSSKSVAGPADSNSLTRELNSSLSDYYHIYVDELEKNFIELFTKNEELKEKTEEINELEEENRKLKLENMKYQKFKKIAFEVNKERNEMKIQNDHLKRGFEKQKLFCDNPYCISDKVSLVEIRKEFDKLLIENAILRKKNYEISKLNSVNMQTNYYKTSVTNETDIDNDMI